jgi:heptosyltransferase I
VSPVLAEFAPPRGHFPGSICIVMLSALGDVVHALPLLDAIKRHSPSSRITWILQAGPALLAQGHPHVDEVVLFHRGMGLAAYRDLARRLRGRSFDLVLALQPYLKAGIITRMLRSPVKLGFDRARARDLNWLFTTHRIPPGPRRHIQDEFLEFLDVLGVPHHEPRWHLEPGAEERAFAKTLLEPLREAPRAGFVVATSKPEKNWPPGRYAELADRLRAETGARAVLLGSDSPIERAAAAAIEARSRAEPLDLLGVGLRNTIALLAECDVVVSSDTGPYHMCVAMGVPAVGLYGYTNPKRVGPYRRFGELVVDAYGNPGEDYPVTARYRSGRMTRIGVEEVLRKVKLALERYPRPQAADSIVPKR